MDLFDVMLAKKIAGGGGTDSRVIYFSISDQSEINLWELDKGIYCGDGEILYYYNETEGAYVQGSLGTEALAPVCFVVGIDSANAKSVVFLTTVVDEAYTKYTQVEIAFPEGSNDGLISKREVAGSIQPDSQDYVDAGTIYDAIQAALVVDTEAVVE